jgi:hypothetical protein
MQIFLIYQFVELVNAGKMFERNPANPWSYKKNKKTFWILNPLGHKKKTRISQ